MSFIPRIVIRDIHDARLLEYHIRLSIQADLFGVAENADVTDEDRAKQADLESLYNALLTELDRLEEDEFGFQADVEDEILGHDSEG